jgi:hypothetical protein
MEVRPEALQRCIHHLDQSVAACPSPSSSWQKHRNVGDRSCLLVVPSCMQGTEHGHADLRARIVAFMRDNEADFAPFVEDDQSFSAYMARMKKVGGVSSAAPWHPAAAETDTCWSRRAGWQTQHMQPLHLRVSWARAVKQLCRCTIHQPERKLHATLHSSSVSHPCPPPPHSSSLVTFPCPSVAVALCPLPCPLSLLHSHLH